jgi:hypothetical protein
MNVFLRGWMLLTAVFLLIGVMAGQAAEPMHVTYLWHMHQPVYFPYESVGDTDANGRFNFSVAGVINDRLPNYQYWPRDAVQQGADRGMAHAGAQMSFSGSLVENCNNMWGYSTGASWDDAFDWARNSLRTSLGNPRLDIVSIPYHHSLMPLTCKESMIMQLRLHKEQFKEVWDTTEYPKGLWPPECAFAEWIIPAMAEEGLDWVIVDNGHLFRTVPDFPWSSASSCRPNPAEIQNPSSTALGSEWVQLQNVWAPTKVLAPWAYQPHYVQYVDPYTGDITKVIAVPAGRYEGNENGRGGYGAFKPENVWGTHVGSVNTDADKPMLLLCHSDGDNYGMKNSDAWNGQHGLFLDMVQSNPDFTHTTVEDYLEMYPPDTDDVIHVEPGSWIGIDGGTPYFDKWLSSTYVDGECPDRWSWSVLIAAQNRVLHADALESDYTMDDVEWGVNHDTAKAWHFYLVAETSCYWYWDLDRANPWDGNVTRACNLAVAEADKVIGRHAGTDTVGPSIFPPQRDPYNPGGYMWDEAEPAASDFEVWTFVDDASGLQTNSVKVYWRTDKDGQNPISNTDNETFAGGSSVNAWNTETMTGSWDPAIRGPLVPAPFYRAQMFKATITGQDNVLIDYFVEAVDNNGNTNRSEIMHVWVGESYQSSPVTFDPTAPQDCDDLVVMYNAANTVLSNASSVSLLITEDNWANTSTVAMAGTSGGMWYATNGLTSGTTAAAVKFEDGGTVDNNGGDGWSVDVSACSTPSTATFDPPNPNGCEAVTITYTPGDGVLQSASPVHIHVGYNDWQGVITPDPAMTASGDSWTYTYTPPAGTYEINACFNDNGGIWDSNNGNDWNVAVTNCSSSNAVVQFSPASPQDCDTLTTTYNPDGRPLDGETNVHIDITIKGTTYRYPMTDTNGLWTIDNGLISGTTNVRVQFVDANVGVAITDDNDGAYWSVAVSACNTSGPSAVQFNPTEPTGCDDVTITYLPNEGPLKNASQVYIHVGHDGWQSVIDPAPAMTESDGNWVYTYSPVGGTEQINCCFHDGDSTWDNNNGADWSVEITGCTGDVSGVRMVEYTPAITDDPPTNQNNWGDAFDMATSGGSLSSTNEEGFGSFGKIYANYDADNLYFGGVGTDPGGDNNGIVLFLHINTYPDWAAIENLWAVSGDPSGLDAMHNVAFSPKACVAIVLGDEWGDGTFPQFQLTSGDDFGQGVFYISTGLNANFEPVPGAKLSQYDGTGSEATGSNDSDGDRLVDRWEVCIPWISLHASNGVSDVTNCTLSGVIASSSTNENNRYLSSSYLAASMNCTSNLDAYGNFGYAVVTLEGEQIGLPIADSDKDGIPDWWERRYFSSLGMLSEAGDWDEDGLNDLREYMAGTNPKDASSCFLCQAPQPDAGGNRMVIRWQSASNKTYTLLGASNLLDNVWTPLQSSISATPPQNTYTADISGLTVRFFQVETRE